MALVNNPLGTMFDNTNLVAYYKFADNVNDSFGSNHLTAGGTTAYVQGLFNPTGTTGGFKTSGDNGYANLSSSMGITSLNFTLSFWYKYITTTDGRLFTWTAKFGNPTLAGSFSSEWVAATSRIYFGTEGLGGGSGFIVKTLPSTSFTHFCYTITPSNSYMYVNGSLQVKVATGTNQYPLPDNFNIAAYQTDNPRRIFQNGIYSDFSIFSRVWSPQEVYNYYNQYKSAMMSTANY